MSANTSSTDGMEDHNMRKPYPSNPLNKLPVIADHAYIYPSAQAADTAHNAASTRNSRSSVKHLTCFWWKEKGSCRYSDADCLYAHHDTGHYTDPPRQLLPGEPALAGRKLDRAMRSLAATYRSSPSVPTMPGSRHGSRSNTPAFERNSPLPSPFSNSHSEAELARLTNDNHFLKTLVDQNSREKAVIISHIEELQADNKGMKSEVVGLRQAQEQVLQERDGLKHKINQLQVEVDHLHSLFPPFASGHLYPQSQADCETRYLGSLLEE